MELLSLRGFATAILAAPLALALAACLSTPPFPEEAPEAWRAEWPLIAARCGRCHTLRRAMDARKTPEQWAAIVDRMAAKPGSGIGSGERRRIARVLGDWAAQMQQEEALTPDTRPDIPEERGL